MTEPRSWHCPVNKFPNSTELDHYVNARVSNIIGEYFDGIRDFRAQYETYLSRRKTVVSPTPFRPEELLQAEIDKFKFIYSTIREWLESSMGRTEKEWQQKILSFIQLIFPKYVAVLENVQIEDHYSIPGRTKKRFIDIALVDANPPSWSPVLLLPELAAIAGCCGGAGWFPPAEAVSARADPADAAPEEVPAAAPPDDPAPAAATPAMAPSMPAAPAVRAVTAVPTIAAAVLPTSPLTIRLAMKGITAIASE
jgi:hypothetical protein